MHPSPSLLSLAALQNGVVSRTQAFGLGLTREPLDRLVAEGRWRRLDPGLFLVHDQPPDWLALAWGGLLLGGDASRLGGPSAGFLHGLNPEPDSIEVMVPWGSVLKSRGWWRFVRERPGVRSGRSVGEPPRLTLEDTVLDLTRHASEGEVIDLVTRAVQTRRTSPERLLRALQARSWLSHRRLMTCAMATTTSTALAVRWRLRWAPFLVGRGWAGFPERCSKCRNVPYSEIG
jgi:Transcriptional regulator, AbiEi antitoxin